MQIGPDDQEIDKAQRQISQQRTEDERHPPQEGQEEAEEPFE